MVAWRFPYLPNVSSRKYNQIYPTKERALKSQTVSVKEEKTTVDLRWAQPKTTSVTDPPM